MWFFGLAVFLVVSMEKSPNLGLTPVRSLFITDQCMIIVHTMNLYRANGSGSASARQLYIGMQFGGRFRSHFYLLSNKKLRTAVVRSSPAENQPTSTGATPSRCKFFSANYYDEGGTAID